MNPSTLYPLRAVRALALQAQRLSTPHRQTPSPGVEDVYQTIEQIGWIQIDTLQVVHRSQYLTLWSRLGTYNTEYLDHLLFDGGNTSPDNKRRLFEYWAHAACVIPLKEYRFWRPMMRRQVEREIGRRGTWAHEDENAKLLRSVIKQIEAAGAARPVDFRTEQKAAGTWRNWDQAKIALEHLYNTGQLVISNRINFQRIYDVPARVLPNWVDRNEPTEEEAFRHLLEISIKAHGICQPAQVGDYFHMKRTESKPIIDAMIADGSFLSVQAKLVDDQVHQMLVHPDNLPLLEMAAEGEITPGRTTFLSPFDSLFWAKGRDTSFWNFRQVLECYKPAEIRRWGYFCLPILYRDKLVGRFDPKVERQTGVMRLKKLYLEPKVRPSNRLIWSISRTMKDFMCFHQARNLVIEHSDPPEFGAKLMAAI